MTGIVVIGTSAGGLDALHRVLGALPAGFPAPVVVVQHRQAGTADLLSELLDRRCALPVAEAEDKAELVPGRVLVAPGGYHLLVERGSVALSVDEPVKFSRPAIDVTFESAADAYGSDVVAVVLTGANDDGAEGLAAVRRAGGFTVVQDPATAERAEMPEAARLAARPQAVLGLDEIGPLVARLAAGAAR